MNYVVARRRAALLRQLIAPRRAQRKALEARMLAKTAPREKSEV